MDLYIRHDIQMAHRLINLPGKCQQIHGHSIKVKVSWVGGVNAEGYFTLDSGDILDFSNAKRVVRKYLDETYDHHLLLNQADPWSGTVMLDPHDAVGNEILDLNDYNLASLPGMVIVPADPTTENIALWIAEWTSNRFAADVVVEIDETDTNGVAVAWSYEGQGDAAIVDVALPEEVELSKLELDDHVIIEADRQ